MTHRELSALEICAGGGGQALGLEQAGFEHTALAEIDPDACDTLRANRPTWKVIEGDIRELDGRQFSGIDLLAGGVPCQPFSVGGQQLGSDDERDLFPEAIRLIEEAQPRAVLLENVKGLAEQRFEPYRLEVRRRLTSLGYVITWKTIYANEHGVPQFRPRFVLVALRFPWVQEFTWPPSRMGAAGTVGNTLYDLMSAGGWPGAARWARDANIAAPTIVGGSKKHGGADLGPTRARAAWRRIGVNGGGIADGPPGAEFPEDGLPKLTTRMVARLQGFPDDWEFSGRKTAAYRQVGNAFPPPVARVLGTAIRTALTDGG